MKLFKLWGPLYSLVGAHSLVREEVPSGVVVAGNPAKEICDAASIKLKNNPELSAYPWPRHFDRGYPAILVNSWREIYGEKII